MTATDPRFAHLKRNGRTALRVMEITDRLVRAAKLPGFREEAWDELAALFDTDRYQRIAANRETRGWDEDIRLRHQFALVAEFGHEIRRIVETGDTVFFDTIEILVTKDDSFSINTLGVMEFDEAGLIVRNTTYQQWDPERAPGHVGRGD